MVCTFQALLFSTLVMSSTEGESTGFRLPMSPEGEVETYLDQGLARNKEGQIIDYWRSMDDHIVRIRKLEVPTEDGIKRFDAVIISQREGWIRSSDSAPPAAVGPRSLVATSFVPNLFTYIRDFVYKTYQARAGIGNGELVLKTLQSERDFLNGFSTMVVITEENDFSKIHATFRVVRRGGEADNEEPLDVETSLKRQDLPPLPKIKPRIVKHKGQRVAMGDYAELKTLAVDHSLKIDFVPFLLRSFDTHAMYAFGQRQIEVDGEKLPWGASHLVIEADAARAKLYERLYGFQIDESRSKDGLFVLTTSLEEFEEKIRSGRRNDSPAVQDYVAQPPVVAWTPQRVLSREARDAAQAQAESSALFNRDEAWVRYLSGPVSFYAPPQPVEIANGVIAATNNRLDGALKFTFNRPRYYPKEGSDASKRDAEAVAKGFAPPDLSDIIFETPHQLYEHILQHPEEYFEDIPRAVEFALAHRKDYPQFDIALANLLKAKNSKFIYQALKADPMEQEGESDELKARREQAIELQFKIYDDFYTNPPKDEASLKKIKEALRDAEIPYEAGRILTKLPRLGVSDRKVIFQHTLFYRNSVRDALKVVVEDETLEELKDKESRVSQWFKDGYTYRFVDNGWDIPDLIKTVTSSKPHADRKIAAEQLWEAVQLADELEYILKVMEKKAPQFYKRLNQSFSASIQTYRDAKKAYAEWEKQEREIRNGLRASVLRTSSSSTSSGCVNRLRDMAQ
jgi:hypothetical protein